MIIRPWKQKDIETIAEIERRCFSDAWTVEDLTASLRFPAYQTFLAEEGGQVCGYAVLVGVFETMEIANIAVDIPFRGQGIGKALLTAMHEKAKALGAEECLLEVRFSNAAAISLYEKYGYARYGVRPKYYGDEDALLMRKKL